ncbi:MAG: pilin [Minisyncoccia bacterium]|jgi:hypothetical protein
MNLYKNIFLFSLIFLVGLSFSLHLVFAQDISGTQTPNKGLINPLCPPSDPNCPSSSAEGLLHSIVDWLIRIGTPIAVGMLIIGAFQMMFSGGNEDMIKRGRRTILYTAIGYAIILIGWGLTSIIQDFLSH